MSDLDPSIAVHPVQMPASGWSRARPVVRTEITLRAYEVYKHIFGIYIVDSRAQNAHLHRYVDEFAFRLNEGNVENHTMHRLGAFVAGTKGKRLTYKALIA